MSISANFHDILHALCELIIRVDMLGNLKRDDIVALD